MTKRLEIYRCEVCGNVVEMVHSGQGALVCCGQPMKLVAENTTDASREKHVPVAERTGETLHVMIGSVPHPMEEKHYIEWVEVIAGEHACRQFLSPGDQPEANFADPQGEMTVRAYCNIHGLWKA